MKFGSGNLNNYNNENERLIKSFVKKTLCMHHLKKRAPLNKKKLHCKKVLWIKTHEIENQNNSHCERKSVHRIQTHWYYLTIFRYKKRNKRMLLSYAHTDLFSQML